MEISVKNDTLDSLLSVLNLEQSQVGNGIKQIALSDYKYIKDLKINITNALLLSNLTEIERYILALATAINDKKPELIKSLTIKCKELGVSDIEIAEIQSCVSLLSTNNVFYRFRHFIKKEYYETTPAGIKMSIMMNPVLGKEFFELLSLAISALNGCELCVNAHESSLIQLGTSPARIYDAIKLVSIFRGLTVLI
ncbi:MAG: carboxymuconolactone decarboxylase family protein [Cytophagales bacterium]